jgi:Fe-S cluster biogenesis protein NfuA
MGDKLKEALETIRPYLQRDGGDVEYVDYTEDNILKVRLLGHCAGCPHSQMTIKGGIERILREDFPDLVAVEAV